MRHSMPWKSFALGLTLLGTAASARAELRLVEVVPTPSVVALPRTYVVPTTYLASTPIYATSTSYLAPTTYVAPTSYVSGTSVLLPTSVTDYVVPTSYTYVPTTYVPTTYVPTTYVPTGYVTTRYRGWWPRRYYETTYVSATSRLVPTYYVSPTQYIQPTSYALPTTTTAMCCESSAPAPVQKVVPAPVNPKPSGVQRAADATIESRPAIDSTVAAEPEYRTEANKPARDDAIGTTNASGANAIDATVPPTRSALPNNGGLKSDALKSSAVGDTLSGPANTTPTKVIPAAPVPAAAVPVPKPAPALAPAAAVNKPAPTPAVTNKEELKSSAVDPKKVTLPPPPAVATPPVPDVPGPLEPAPAGPPPLESVPPLPDPSKDDVTRHDSLKPVITTPALSKRNVLEGKIVSADTLKGETGVQVVVSDRGGRFLDRFTRTDAGGHFAMILPEGDWTIKVTMPSGRVLPVEQGNVTANSGKVLDMYGRDLKNLIIRR